MRESDNKTLSRDNGYLFLGAEQSEPIIRYNEFIRRGISESEQRFLKEAYQRNPLTGNLAFIAEIEKR
ncbi:MAG: hypothetical protein AAFZ92_05375, partial [Pseudomonadota bacterium]